MRVEEVDRCSAASKEVPCRDGSPEGDATSDVRAPSGASSMFLPAPACAAGWQVRVARRVSTATPIGVGMSRRTSVGPRWPMSPVSVSRFDPRVPMAAETLLSKPPNGGRMGMVVLPVSLPAGKANRFESRRSLPSGWRGGGSEGLVQAVTPLSHHEGSLERGCNWWSVHGRCGSTQVGLAGPGIDGTVGRSGADVEFSLLWGEFRLSRQGVQREHRKQVNPYATRLKCTVSRPACPSPF